MFGFLKKNDVDKDMICKTEKQCDVEAIPC